jgi:hypothetical protein
MKLSGGKTKLTKVLFLASISILCLVPLFIMMSKFSISAYKNYLKPTFQVHNVTVKFQYFYSEKLKLEIMHEVSHLFNKQDFYQLLKNKFKIIKNIEWQMAEPGHVKMVIEGVQPYCKVNNKFVLGNKRRLFPFSFFENYKLDNISNIWLSEKLINQKLDLGLYNFVRHIPCDMWNNFEICYLKPSYIKLLAKTPICKCLVIADEKNIFDKRKFEMIGTVFDDMCYRGFVTEKILTAQYHRLVFDLRLGERILVKFFDPFKRGEGR